jgi:hypothetical protein
MKGFTGIKDLDKELLLKMDDREFIKSCSLNTYFYDLCEEQNELLFKRKLQLAYPDTLNPKVLNPYWVGSWKFYYASVVKTIARLKEKFDFTYPFGNPFKQYTILSGTNNSPGPTLDYGILNNELALVQFAVEHLKAKIYQHQIDNANKLSDKTIYKFLQNKM